MSDTARVIELQARLRAALTGIIEHAEALASERCPYRAADDRCTYSYGCSNRSNRGELLVCSGAQLNTARWPE